MAVRPRRPRLPRRTDDAGDRDLHSTLQTRGTELVPTARGKSFSLFALAFFVGGSGGTAVFGRLLDNRVMALAMAICGIGLGAVGELVTGEQPMERAR